MKSLHTNLKVKLDRLRRNPYLDDLPEEMLKEIAGQMQPGAWGPCVKWSPAPSRNWSTAVRSASRKGASKSPMRMPSGSGHSPSKGQPLKRAADVGKRPLFFA
jgi:hypothetical protein